MLRALKELSSLILTFCETEIMTSLQMKKTEAETGLKIGPSILFFLVLL